MATSDETPGDRIAAAIDRQLRAAAVRQLAAATDRQLDLPDWELYGIDFTDGVFRDAYEHLSSLGIPPLEVARVLERTRKVWDVCFTPWGPPNPDDLIFREWRETLRGLLVGYSAMREATGTDHAAAGPAAPTPRVCFDDPTWRVFVDGRPHQVATPVAYRIWRTVFEVGLDYISEAEIFRRMGRKRAKPIHRYRDDLPAALNQMLIGEPGSGYTIQLPLPPDEALQNLL